VILVEMGALLSLEILLKTLAFPYYLGNTDIAFHEQFAHNIVVEGHVGDFMGYYRFFPVLHITSAVLTLCLPTLTTAMTIRVLFCGCGFVLPLILFSILHRTTKRFDFAVTASFLGSFGAMIVINLGEGMPHFLAFIFVLYILMVVLRGARNMRFYLAGLAFLIAIVFTHQVSIPYFIAVLVGFYLLYHHFFQIDSKAFRSGLHFIFLIAFFYVAYSVIQALSFYGNLLSLFSISADVNLPPQLVTQSAPSYSYYFLMRIPLAVMLSLAFLGILSFSGYSNAPTVSLRARPLTIIGLVATFSVVPGFYSLSEFLGRYVGGGGRNLVFSELVVACFVALFLLRSRAHSRRRTRFVIVLALWIVVFGSFINSMNTEDTDALGTIGTLPRVYYGNRDISGLTYLESHPEIGSLLSDFRSSRFLGAHGVVSYSPYMGANGTVGFPSGSTVYLKSGDLESNGVAFIQPGSGGAFDLTFTNLGPISSVFFRDQNNVVFDLGTIQVVVCQKESWIGGG
jgi:hypothetical protein